MAVVGHPYPYQMSGPSWGRRGDGLLGVVGAGDPAYRVTGGGSERRLYVRGGNREMSLSKPA